MLFYVINIIIRLVREVNPHPKNFGVWINYFCVKLLRINMAKKHRSIKLTEPRLEQLFGSKTRLQLLKLFFNNPDKIHYVREMVRETNTQINSIRRELENLQNLGIIVESTPNLEEAGETERTAKKTRKNKQARQKHLRKKYFQVNTNFILYQELKSLLLKAQLLLEKNLIKGIQKLGNIYYLVLAGFFLGQKNARTDILIIGKMNRRKIKTLIKDFEKDFGREINYTVLSRREFNYRKDITDRFLYDILENKKMVVVDRLA
jgi:hypothetical protein